MNNVNYNNDEMEKLSKALEKAIVEFTPAIDSLTNLDIPDFEMAGYLRSCSSLLSTYKRTCKENIDWIKNCSLNFSNFNTNSIDSINAIDIEVIKNNSMQIK